jgi:hypothetical protein
MKKSCKKLMAMVGMVVCIGGACVGCTTKNAEDVQDVEQQSTNEAQPAASSEVIEKEVEIDSDSGEKIEFSIDGAAGEVE